MAVETYFEDGEWKVKGQGNSKASSVHKTKFEAQKQGRLDAIKKETEHIIKNKNGQIGKRNSYGKDKNPPKG